MVLDFLPLFPSQSRIDVLTNFSRAHLSGDDFQQLYVGAGFDSLQCEPSQAVLPGLPVTLEQTVTAELDLHVRAAVLVWGKTDGEDDRLLRRIVVFLQHHFGILPKYIYELHAAAAPKQIFIIGHAVPVPAQIDPAGGAFVLSE